MSSLCVSVSVCVCLCACVRRLSHVEGWEEGARTQPRSKPRGEGLRLVFLLSKSRGTAGNHAQPGLSTLYTPRAWPCLVLRAS